LRQRKSKVPSFSTSLNIFEISNKVYENGLQDSRRRKTWRLIKNKCKKWKFDKRFQCKENIPEDKKGDYGGLTSSKVKEGGDDQRRVWTR